MASSDQVTIYATRSDGMKVALAKGERLENGGVTVEASDFLLGPLTIETTRDGHCWLAPDGERCPITFQEAVPDGE